MEKMLKLNDKPDFMILKSLEAFEMYHTKITTFILKDGDI